MTVLWSTARACYNVIMVNNAKRTIRLEMIGPSTDITSRVQLTGCTVTGRDRQPAVGWPTVLVTGTDGQLTELLKMVAPTADLDSCTVWPWDDDYR